MLIQLEINGKNRRITTDPRRRLLDILRDDFGLLAVKEGCGQGECGSCTVYLNGQRVNACLIPALQLNGSRVFTLEGVQQWQTFKSVEEVFIAKGAVQCGFCIPGMVMSALAFIKEADPPYNPDQIKSAIAGNMCRCTGYIKIIETLEYLGEHDELITDVKKGWPG